MLLNEHCGGYLLCILCYVSNVSCMLDLCPGVTFSMTAAAPCGYPWLHHAMCLPLWSILAVCPVIRYHSLTRTYSWFCVDLGTY